MKYFVLIFALSLALPASAQPTPKQEADAVFNTFLTGLTNVEVDKVLGLFAPDALFWGTSSPALVNNLDGVRAYFSNLSGGKPGQNVASALHTEVKQLSNDVILLSGTWQIHFAANDTTNTLRVSIVMAKQNGRWVIVQFHNSALPASRG